MSRYWRERVIASEAKVAALERKADAFDRIRVILGIDSDDPADVVRRVSMLRSKS